MDVFVVLFGKEIGVLHRLLNNFRLQNLNHSNGITICHSYGTSSQAALTVASRRRQKTVL